MLDGLRKRKRSNTCFSSCLLYQFWMLRMILHRVIIGCFCRSKSILLFSRYVYIRARFHELLNQLQSYSFITIHHTTTIQMALYLGSRPIFYSDPFDDVRVTYFPSVSTSSYVYYNDPAPFYHINPAPFPYRTVSYDYFI